MALVNCRECGKEVSTEARTCPHCGVLSPGIKGWKGSGIDWKAGPSFYGYPLIHVAFGKDANGKLRVAKGVIAIGQFAIGLITIAQFGIGILFGFGQFIFGLMTIAQFAVGVCFGLGQFASGYIAVGQVAVGWYVLAQTGFARYIWTPGHRDIEAVLLFQEWLDKAKLLFHIR